MAQAAFLLGVLAFMGRAEAISKSEQIAFGGVDTLQVLFSLTTGAEDVVSKRHLRNKVEFVLRTAGVPVDPDDTPRSGPWLEIHVVAVELEYKDGRGTGAFAYAVYVGLYEVLTVWRENKKRQIGVATWTAPVRLSTVPKKEARDSLLDYIAEVAEEVSNLYLATR